MKKLLSLQNSRDSLRFKLGKKIKLNQFDQEFKNDSKKLRHLDDLFFRLIKKSNLSLSKFGRLIKQNNL
jgi:hypothetical protein